MKLVAIAILGFMIAGGINTSCTPYIANPCDTCNLNQDSLQRVKDSLAHVFEWKEYTIPGIPSATGVCVFAPNDIFIIAAHLYHLDGINITELPLFHKEKPTIGVDLADFNLFALSKTDFWMIHSGGSIAFHCIDGKFVEDNRPGGALNACWGLSSNDMFFVGDAGHIYHYDGSKFTEMQSGTTKNLRSVWGTSNSDVWTGGHTDATGQSILLHYDGVNWQEVSNLSSPPLNIYPGAYGHSLEYVWSTDSSGHKIVIPSGSTVWRKTDNGSWRSDTTLIPNRTTDGGFIALAGTQGNNADDFMTVGGWGWVGHWNGKTWKKYEELYDYGNPNYGALSFSMRGNTACVVGVKNGQSWIAVGTRKQ